MQEEVTYLAANLDFLREEESYGNIEDKLLCDYAWEFCPERYLEWQKVSSDNLMARYGSRSSDACEEILLEKKFNWTTIQDEKFVLKLCLEWWFTELFYDFYGESDEERSLWFCTSWMLYDKEIGLDVEIYAEYRQRVFREDDIRKIYQKMKELFFGELKKTEIMTFEMPIFRFKFIPALEKKSLAIELEIRVEEGDFRKIRLKGDQLEPLAKVIEEAREGIYYTDGEDLDEGPESSYSFVEFAP